MADARIDNAPIIVTGSGSAKRGAGLEGSYRMIRLLGRGTMSSVYLAEQLSMARRVALKILSPAFAADPEFVDRFLKEARASARLNHPNIVGAIDFGELDSRYFLVMEFVDGDTLSALIAREAPLDETRVIAIGRQAILALEHAAGHNVVHRDVKPANIMIAKDGTVKLADFGLALLVDAPHAREASHRAAGTPFYMAPEIIEGANADWRADQCSLGQSLYEAVTGKKPFAGKNVSDVFRARLHDSPVPAHRLNPAASRGFSGILAKMTARSPAERYQNFRDLKKDFDRIAKGKHPALAKSARTAYLRGRRPGGSDAAPARGSVERARIKRRVGLALQAGIAFLAVMALFVMVHRPEVRGPRPAGVAPGPDRAIDSRGYSSYRAMRSAWRDASRLSARAERSGDPEALAAARGALREIVETRFFDGTVYAAMATGRLRELDAAAAEKDG